MKFSMQELLYASALTGAGVGSMHWLGLVPTVVVLLGWFLVTRKLWEPFRSFLLAIFTVGLLAVLLLPSISSRPVPKCVICWNNMRQLAITLLNYEAAFGAFPPAYVTDDDGKPMHSWRVLILTAIEYPELHKQYRFDEPWDSPHNLKLSKVDIPLFRCPCRNSPPGTCDYSVVITESSPMRKDFGMRSSDIQRPSHVGLLTENATPVPWTKPDDVTPEDIVAAARSQRIHPYLPIVFADGHFVRKGNGGSIEDYRQLFSNGGRSTEESLPFLPSNVRRRTVSRQLVCGIAFIAIALMPFLLVWRRWRTNTRHRRATA